MDNDKNFEEQLLRVHKELSILYKVSNAMRTTLELNHILYIILTGVTAHSGLGFNRALLFLVNKERRLLECKMVIGPESGERAQEIWQYFRVANPELEDLITPEKVKAITQQSSLYHRLKEIKIPLQVNDGGGLLAQTYFTGNPLHIGPDDIHKYAEDPLLKIFETKEMVVMPLKAKDEVKGLIVADNVFTQRPISEDDLQIFTMLANQAGLAIENSILYELVVHKSHTDSLTNLWNHGYFQDTLTVEIEKARRNNQPLSVALIDMDNFKKLNDTLGHQNGDTILRELANILKSSSRETDYTCRYGGEEFSIILPQTSKDNAFTILERIREKIAQYSFSTFSGQPIKLTVSIGLAAFPEDAKNKEEVIAKADRSLYIAKFSGKNMTCAARPSD